MTLGEFLQPYFQGSSLLTSPRPLPRPDDATRHSLLSQLPAELPAEQAGKWTASDAIGWDLDLSSLDMASWLVVTGCHQFGIFPFILGIANHPNWRTHIFQRGGPGPPTRFVYPDIFISHRPSICFWRFHFGVAVQKRTRENEDVAGTIWIPWDWHLMKVAIDPSRFVWNPLDAISSS